MPLVEPIFNRKGDKMKRYPVYKALYKPFLTAGVPLLVLIMEITFAALFITVGIYLAAFLVAIIHICAMVAIKSDPFILSILFDLSSLSDKKGGDQ